ncbi:response regulator transcription factor [Bathymodiolus platifrons methanotrophic gill symbiont]|uniref:response regulator transcription factor n=1 Tax=Bathymodiolus platifrons methanotrophic gill symbiont TaxID=113268 RepID=UPI001124D74A|nr:response regulator [Bathymodiolus platifrons methanotrophic gill symbiont]
MPKTSFRKNSDSPKYHPDLVITDLRMDEMGGMQLCKLIQQGYPTLPIIIIRRMAQSRRRLRRQVKACLALLPNR